MDMATEIALAQILGALHRRNRIDPEDVAEIVSALQSIDQRAGDHITEPLNLLALSIAETAN
jgi:hypothetical protein